MPSILRSTNGISTGPTWPTMTFVSGADDDTAGGQPVELTRADLDERHLHRRAFEHARRLALARRAAEQDVQARARHGVLRDLAAIEREKRQQQCRGVRKRRRGEGLRVVHCEHGQHRGRPPSSCHAKRTPAFSPTDLMYSRPEAYSSGVCRCSSISGASTSSFESSVR